MVILPSYVQLPEEHHGNKQRRVRLLYMYSLLGAWASLCWVSVKQVLAIRTIYIKLSELCNHSNINLMKQ